MKKLILTIPVFLLIFSFSSFAQNTSDPEIKLKELGIELPTPSQPMANYVKYVKVGNLIFLAGHGTCRSLSAEERGKLGADLDIEQGYQIAREVGICLLATLKSAVGNLNQVQRIVKATGMVNSDPEFIDQPKVVNGFSDLMVEVFGEKGKHARAAVGMASLPGNIPVEIEIVVEIKN